MTDDWIDLGLGSEVQRGLHPDTGELLGFHWRHYKPDGSFCHQGFIATHYENPDLGWQLVSLDPLTLAPSLLCRVCGTHGFIRDGKWMPV